MDPPNQSVKTILSLSDEVLLNIFNKLEMCDKVQLSETCQRFQRILHDRTICQDLCIPWNIGTSQLSTITFIEQRSSIITSLTLTNITWIPAYIIKRIVLNLPLLKGLHVAGTRFYWAHLHEVLKSPLPILDKLSWTYDNNLEKSIINQIKKQKAKTEKSNKVYDMLLLLREKFQQFKYLLFHINKDSIRSTSLRRNFQGISYIVSLCTNIEEFWLIGMEQADYFNGRYDAEFELWNVDYSKDFPNLHTLVVTLATSLSFQNDLPEIVHYLLDAFEKNNARNAISDLKSTMKLWMGPSFRSRRTAFRPGFNLSSLLWFSYENFQTDLDTNIDLSQLKKLDFGERGEYGELRNPLQIHKLLENAPNLESFTCHLGLGTKLDWSQMAANNSMLKEIRVWGSRTLRGSGYEKFAEGCADIAKLSLLQKISLPLSCLIQITAAETILQYNSDLELAEMMDGTMLRTPDGSSKQNQHQRLTGLDCLTLNCHNVKEFELGKQEGDDGDEFGNVGMALSNISRWALLEYLTLSCVPLIGDGKFLIQVAESCKLKSLRIVHLGPWPAKNCSYTASLYTALKLMPHLKDFRFEQNNIGSVTPLFEALQSCPKLQRLAVCANVNFSSGPLEASVPLKLMNTSRYLYLFFLSLPSLSKASCEFLTRRIIEKFKSSRPALNVFITNNTEREDRKMFFNNYVHHCGLMQCRNESCFKLYDSY